MGRIEWLPIAGIPDALKDGRQVLLWDWSGAQTATWRADRGAWDTGFASEIDGDPMMVEEPTMFAEINPPT